MGDIFGAESDSRPEPPWADRTKTDQADSSDRAAIDALRTKWFWQEGLCNARVDSVTDEQATAHLRAERSEAAHGVAPSG